MKISHNDLKKIYYSHILKKAPPSRRRCPSLNKIFNIFGKSVSRRTKGKIIDHITNCSCCLQEFELSLALYRHTQKAIQEIDNILKQENQTSFIREKTPLFLSLRYGIKSLIKPYWRIASLLLSIFIFIGFFLIADKWSTQARKHEERGSSGQIQLLFPIQQEEVNYPLIFRWEPMSRAEHYVLEIFDHSLLPIWKSPKINDSNCPLPSAVAERIKPKTVYFWMVTAFLPNGIKTESPLEEFKASW